MAGILIWAQTQDGEIKKITRETAEAGHRLAAARGTPLAAVVIGDAAAAGELGKLGFQTIYSKGDPTYTPYTSEAYTDLLEEAGKEMQADTYILGATALGRDLAARLAARIGGALATDVIEISYDSSPLTVIRPVYSGKLNAEVELSTEPSVLTLRPNVFPAAEDRASSAEIKELTGPIAPIRAVIQKAVQGAQDVLDVTEAEIIVSGGRGVGGPDGFAIIENLAKTLGAAVGSSRVAVDEGWIPYQHQVGQTGKVVSPVLYIACGISGAIQHFAGMGSSKYIIAINKDPDAPIMKKADFAIVGDLFQIVPVLASELAKAISS